MSPAKDGILAYFRKAEGKTGRRMKEFLEKSISEGVFPGAVLLVSHGGEIVIHQEVGLRSLIPKREPMAKDTIFDLASLTKPLATTLALMKLVEEGKMGLDQPLSELITKSSLEEKKALTPRLLLNHSAGFPGWKPYYLDLVNFRPEERKSVLREQIIGDPLAYSPGEDCLYSDLGFMILEWIIEEASEMAMHKFVERNFYQPLLLKRTFLSTGGSPEPFDKSVFAATEDCPWRNRVIRGEVHDENAHAVGGYSGHAGLFGTAEEVYAIVNLLREHYLGKRGDYLRPETVRKFFTRQDLVNGCTWALGWDTPCPQDSSSGKYFSPRSVGHLGFTGTSIWVDLEQDVIVILLTHRIHPSRDNEKIKTFRPKLHDLIMEQLGFGH